MEKKVIIAEKGAPPAAPYSPGIKIGNLLFISGQIPFKTGINECPDAFQDQVKITLENIKGIIEAAGGSMDNIVKTTVFLTDMKNFSKMNQIYNNYFPDKPPARSCVEVGGLPLFSQIEIEAIAYLP